MDTNPETPAVTTPTVTVPSTTVQTLQSTVTSSSSSVTVDTNPEIPVVTTPTVTVPSTTVQTLQSTVTSSSHVTHALREEITTASKESGICEDEIDQSQG